MKSAIPTTFDSARLDRNPSSDAHPYKVELNLHHPYRDPAQFTGHLGLQPWFARRKGDVIASIEHKQSSWLCHFQEGSSNAEFEQTLQALIALIAKHRTFFQAFAEEEGTAEVELNANVSFDDGIIYDLSLAPAFLEGLAQANIQLRLKVWSGEESSDTTS